MSRIWEVLSDPNRYLCVQQSDLRYFRDRFIGQPTSGDWEPPAFEILNRSKKVADFTSWQIRGRVLLVSDRARKALLPVCQDGVEFLQFATIKRVNLFAMNVLKLEELIDFERSRIKDHVVESIVFRDMRTEPPVVFKDPRLPDMIFGTDALRNLALAHELIGLCLADPAKERMRQIVRREPINEFGGL
ncbi:MAG TPA: hypothetical protein VEW04_05130 [Allosphingosinicella sp.]|nr:hypothetical protein [Allosphingosinicella sp.]